MARKSRENGRKTGIWVTLWTSSDKQIHVFPAAAAAAFHLLSIVLDYTARFAGRMCAMETKIKAGEVRPFMSWDGRLEAKIMRRSSPGVKGPSVDDKGSCSFRHLEPEDVFYRPSWLLFTWVAAHVCVATYRCRLEQSVCVLTTVGP